MQFSFRPHLRSKDDSVFWPIYKQIGISGAGKNNAKRRSFCNRLLTNLYETKATKLILHLGKDKYGPGTVYHQAKNNGVTYRTAKKVITLLFQAELIDVFQGDNSSAFGTLFSNVRPTLKLRKIFDSIDPIEIVDDEPEVKIKSEDKNGNDIFLNLPIDNTYLESVIETMKRHNKAVKNVEITYHPSETIQMFYPDNPSLIKTRLTASYSNDLDHGGRMNGGCWINLRRHQRHYLKIDGEDLVMFDFSHFHTAILYKKIGKQAPDLPYIFKSDDPKRKIAKKLQNIMFNISGKGRSHKQKVNDVILAYRETKINKETGKIEVKNPYIPREELKFIIEQLEQKHHLIKEFYYSKCWGELQKIESDLMRIIMNRCMDIDIIILPIHDGFLCKKSDTEKVREILNSLGYEYEDKELSEAKRNIEQELLMKYLLNIKYYTIMLEFILKNSIRYALSPLKGYNLLKCSNIPWKRNVSIPNRLNDTQEKMISSGNYVWVVDHKEQKPILTLKGYAHDFFSPDEYNDFLRLPEEKQPSRFKNYFWQ